MRTGQRYRLRRRAGSTLLLVLIVGLSSLFAPGASTQEVCESGETWDIFPLADVTLLEDALPGSRLSLTRVIVQPGETLDATFPPSSAYFVESGVLNYPLEPGLSIFMSPACGATGGTTIVDDVGVAAITPGQALIAENVPTGPITNDGNEPLVMLQIMLVPAEIDPATGKPKLGAAGDQAANKAWDEQRKACREAAKAADRGEASGAPVATPSAIGGDQSELPRACRR